MIGQAPNPVTDVKIDKDGTVTAQYKDGSSKSLYRVPLATVASPDNLTLESGNVYSANGQSGVTVTGFPQTGGFGYIQSGALEESDVDLASELTNMIEAPEKPHTQIQGVSGRFRPSGRSRQPATLISTIGYRASHVAHHSTQ